MTYLWASPERSGWVCGFSAIIAEKNSPQKNFGSRKNPFYYHFYYYNGESCDVFCKILFCFLWTCGACKTALTRHISA